MIKEIFVTTDQLQLCASRECVGSNTCVVMCHGINGDKEEKGLFVLLSKQLKELNIDCFRFDFRAHGESEGEMKDVSISKEIEDVESALIYLKQYHYNNIFLLGASFGGGVVSLLDYKQYEEIKGLILWYPSLDYMHATFLNAKERRQAKKEGSVKIWKVSKSEYIEYGKQLALERERFKPTKHLKGNKLPKLFVHGDKDNITNYKRNTVKPAKKSPYSTAVIIRNAEHCFLGKDKELYQKEAIQVTIDFIVSHLKGENHAKN